MSAPHKIRSRQLAHTVDDVVVDSNEKSWNYTITLNQLITRPMLQGEYFSHVRLAKHNLRLTETKDITTATISLIEWIVNAAHSNPAFLYVSWVLKIEEPHTEFQLVLGEWGMSSWIISYLFTKISSRTRLSNDDSLYCAESGKISCIEKGDSSLIKKNTCLDGDKRRETISCSRNSNEMNTKQGRQLNRLFLFPDFAMCNEIR